MNNIISQLIDTYQNFETWHIHKLDIQDSEEYFIRLLSQGNIIIFMDSSFLVGYVEFWRITPNQLTRILSKEPFFVFDENIVDGEICYISDIFIHAGYRKGIAFRYLKQLFLNANSDCKFFVGEDVNNHRNVIKRGNLYGKRKNHCWD